MLDSPLGLDAATPIYLFQSWIRLLRPIGVFPPTLLHTCVILPKSTHRARELWRSAALQTYAHSLCVSLNPDLFCFFFEYWKGRWKQHQSTDCHIQVPTDHFWGCVGGFGDRHTARLPGQSSQVYKFVVSFVSCHSDLRGKLLSILTLYILKALSTDKQAQRLSRFLLFVYNYSLLLTSAFTFDGLRRDPYGQKTCT